MAHNADAAYYSSTDSATVKAVEEDKKWHGFSSKYTMDVYEGLGIEEEFKKAGLDISKTDWEKKFYKGTEREANKVRDVIANFDENICTICINLRNPPGLQELIFDENGCMYDQIRGYLEKIHNGRYHLQAHQDDDEGCPKFTVYSTSQSMCDKVCRRLENAFVKQIISHKEMKQREVADFIDEWTTKRKLKVVFSSSEAASSVVICMTSDLSLKLSHLFSDQYRNNIFAHVHVPLPRYYLVFLKKVGQKVLNSEANKAGIQASFDEDSKTLKLGGYCKDVERFKTCFRDKFYSAYLPVSLNYTNLAKLSPDYDAIAAANECTWSVTPLDQPIEMEGFEVLTTIYHPAKHGSLSCITGNVRFLNVDGLILLVTDKLFPLHKFKGNFEPLFGRPQPEKQLTPGDFVHEKTLSAPFGSIFQIVSAFANVKDETEHHSDTLYRVFNKMFSKLDQYKVKTICLPVSEMLNHYTAEDVVLSFIDSIMETNFEQMDIKFYVCFEEDFPDTKKICDDITERFRKKDKGFLRRHCLKTVKKDVFVKETVKIQYDSRRLQEVSVDTIVNTSRVDLSLDKGVVSSSLLQAAGQELQKYCLEHYQKGITMKEVAVTPCFNISDRNKNLKKILHGALPPCRLLTFQQDIKNFMKLCLSKAEELGFESIAFPSLGTGGHGNPVRETIKVMFDAVEEYQAESLKQTLKKIIFSFPSDDCRMAFENEDQRRKNDEKVKFYCFENIDCEYLEETIINYYGYCSIIYGKKHWFEDLPSYTVDVDFEPGKSTYFKYGCERPFSENDLLVLELEVTNTECVKSAIRSCLQQCQNRRITEISLNKIQGLPLTTTQYYQAVTEAVLAFIKAKKEPFYLRKVYIKLDDEELQTLESHFLTSRRWKDYLASLSNIGRMPMQVQILGTTNDSVLKVKDDFMRLMRKQPKAAADAGEQVQGESQDSADLGARPKDTPANRQMERKKESLNDNGEICISKSQNYQTGFHSDVVCFLAHLEHEVLKIRGEVSAEINPGFFRFKKKFNDLNSWVQKIQQEFQVKVHVVKEKYIVKGNYREVSALKYYLDFSFPEEPSKTLVENILTVIQNDSIQNKRGTHELMKVLVKVDEDLAEAVCRLYRCDEVEGVLNWQYSAEQKGLCVTCHPDVSCDVEHIEKDVEKKADALFRDSCYFKDANESMFAESVCDDLQKTKERKVYLKFVSQESKITIIAKDKQSASNAKKDLLKKVKENVSGTEGVEKCIEISGTRCNSHHTQTEIIVRIYKGDIVKLPVMAIVLPAQKSADMITGVQKYVLDTAGEDVKHEYKKLFSGSAEMAGGDCKITSAGNLHFEKLYHIYLPRFEPDREKNIEQINMFEKVLVKTFMNAETDGILSIGLPFIGSGNTGYGLDICVQQYFRAVTSTEWVNTNLTEIHFVGTNKEQVDKVRRMFEKLTTKYQGKRTVKLDENDQPNFPAIENHLSSDVILLGKTDKVKLYIAKGSVTAVMVDSVTCPVGEQFLLNDGIAREIRELCGQEVENKLLKQKQKAPLPKDPGLFEISVRGSNATFHTVVFAVVPRLSEPPRKHFEKIVKDVCFLVLQNAKERGFKTVAIPLLGMEERNDSAVKLCCSAMIEGIFDFVNQYEEAVMEIHILDKDPQVLGQFREFVKQRKQDLSLNLSMDSRHFE